MKSQDAYHVLEGEFDMLLCDMNMTSDQSLVALAPLFPKLKIGGLLVFTIKYFGFSNKAEMIQKVVNTTCDYLHEQFFDFEIYFLWSNSVKERTVICKKR